MKPSTHVLIVCLSIFASSCSTPTKPNPRGWSVDPVSGALSHVPLTIPDLELELIPIAPGTFTMGSPVGEQGHKDNEGPQTKMKITGGFWLGKTEVTQSQWHAIMGRTIQDQFHKHEHRREFRIPGVSPTHPMYYVSYLEIVEFCQKLTAREQTAHRLPRNYAYTLPTEAQWEYACKAGSDDPLSEKTLGTFEWYKVNSGEIPHPVATKLSNAWGLYDMLGNVGEWCYDYYAHQLPGGDAVDFTGPTSGYARVIRGACYAFDANQCRPALRTEAWASASWASAGFRLALVRIQEKSGESP